MVLEIILLTFAGIYVYRRHRRNQCPTCRKSYSHPSCTHCPPGKHPEVGGYTNTAAPPVHQEFYKSGPRNAGEYLPPAYSNEGHIRHVEVTDSKEEAREIYARREREVQQQQQVRSGSAPNRELSEKGDMVIVEREVTQ
jgi:hypothetical protein